MTNNKDCMLVKCPLFMEKGVSHIVGCQEVQFSRRGSYPGQDVAITNASHNELCSVRKVQPLP